MSTKIAAADDAMLAEQNALFDLVAEHMGFVPNSLKVMARRPALLQSFLALSQAVLGPATTISPQLKQLVAYAASLAAGCRYCQAHTAHGASRAGLAKAKLAEAWNYERSPLFSDEERAAMRFAQAAASVPNGVTPPLIAELKRFYDDDAIAEILAVVGLFGFLNRWNDSLATTLEEEPAAFAAEVLKQSGWQAGRHGKEDQDR